MISVMHEHDFVLQSDFLKFQIKFSINKDYTYVFFTQSFRLILLHNYVVIDRYLNLFIAV